MSEKRIPQRLQFSLRSLLLAVLLVAVFFGGREFQKELDAVRRRAEAQRIEAEAEKLAWRNANIETSGARLRRLEREIERAKLDLEEAIRAREEDLRTIKRLRIQIEPILPEPFRPDPFRSKDESETPISEYWQRKERRNGFSPFAAICSGEMLLPRLAD